MFVETNYSLSRTQFRLLWSRLLSDSDYYVAEQNVRDENKERDREANKGIVVAERVMSRIRREKLA